ncbi:MAG: hypothetical protein HKP27_14500, partial [Myxococcales bacterium]|nr:hypothetical protein [Myxococcales bacterium]
MRVPWLAPKTTLAKRLLLLASICAFAGWPSSAQERPVAAPFRAVVTPELEPAAETLAAGVGRVLHRALEARGSRTVPYTRSSRRRVADSEAQLKQLAGRLGADQLVLATWRHVDFRPTLEILVFAGDSGVPVAMYRSPASLGELGRALHAAAGSLWGAPGQGAEDPPPELWEIARYARADAHLSDAELPEAWRALEGLHGPVADALRREIDRANAVPGADPAQRSRLATASERPDPDWNRVRSGLTRSPGPRVLLAAAEAARARRDFKLALRYFAEAREVLDAKGGRDRPPADAALGLIALAGIARSQAELGRAEDARKNYGLWAQRDPEDPTPRAEAADLRGTPPDESARLWIAAADLYRARFETERAARAYEKAALVDPLRRGEVAVRLAYLA